jgi:hydrogenase-4 component F
MLVLLLLVPFLAALLALALRADRLRRGLLVLTAVVHLGLTLSCWALSNPLPRPSAALQMGWLVLDETGLYFLSMTSVLFCLSAVYAAGYLARESHTPEHSDFTEGFQFVNSAEAIFTSCLLFFLMAMTLVTMSQHFGLLWVAIEATTLASAPLIYYHKHPRSLEATWKYLLIASVGIALALLGNFNLAAAAAATSDHEAIPLRLADLVEYARQLNPIHLKVAFLFLLVGYGTKMGLAPMHTWLPDAHSESPSLVSALLSGASLNCAFLGILRAQQVCVAAGLGAFTRELLVGFGLLSMGVAAVFIIAQADFKRMLAYSSVEHMGILALGVGLGGAGVFGAMLHALNHSLTKGALFLVSGNILHSYRTKNVARIAGLHRVLPLSAFIWVVGFLAVAGSPPFGLFLSEFTILKAGLDHRMWVTAGLYLTFLAMIFIGMASSVLGMVQGPAPAKLATTTPEPLWSVGPALVMCGVVLLLGLWVPAPLRSILERVAATLGGS